MDNTARSIIAWKSIVLKILPWQHGWTGGFWWFEDGSVEIEPLDETGSAVLELTSSRGPTMDQMI